MAERTEGRITIDAEPAAIMAEILDYEAYPQWSGEIRKVEVRARDDAGRATEVYYEVQAAILNAKYTLAYTYPSDTNVSWSFVEGGPIRDFQGEYVLTPKGGSTEVVYRAQMDPGVPMMGFMKRQAEKRIVDVALKGLKKRVESRA